MLETLKKNNLDNSIVITLEYNQEDFTVSDISETFRKELNAK